MENARKRNRVRDFNGYIDYGEERYPVRILSRAPGTYQGKTYDKEQILFIFTLAEHDTAYTGQLEIPARNIVFAQAA